MQFEVREFIMIIKDTKVKASLNTSPREKFFDGKRKSFWQPDMVNRININAATELKVSGVPKTKGVHEETLSRLLSTLASLCDRSMHRSGPDEATT